MSRRPEVVNLREVNLRDPDVVRIDRLSRWGNPYRIGADGSRAQVIASYRRWILTRPELLEALDELGGKRLACWCAPRACHGDVLAELVAERAGVEPGTPTDRRHCPRCHSVYTMVTGRDLCGNCTRDLVRAGQAQVKSAVTKSRTPRAPSHPPNGDGGHPPPGGPTPRGFSRPR